MIEAVTRNEVIMPNKVTIEDAINEVGFGGPYTREELHAYDPRIEALLPLSETRNIYVIYDELYVGDDCDSQLCFDGDTWVEVHS